MIKVFGLVFVLMLNVSTSLAYNHKRCVPTMASAAGVGVLVSTVSYVSSTGECAAIGMNKEEQAQHFYAFNQDKVLEDIAKSKGDYLASFEHILGCKVELVELRKNYAELALKHMEDQFQLIRKSCEG